MDMITKETPGLLPLPDNYEGKFLVLSAENLGKRYRVPAYQIVKVTGGFGCDPTKLGTKVFGEFPADGEDFAGRRGDFIGEAPEALICAALDDPRRELLPDLNAMTYLAIGQGYSWGYGANEKEAKAACRKNGKPMMCFYAQEDTRLTEWGSLQWPEGAPEPKEVWRAKGV